MPQYYMNKRAQSRSGDHEVHTTGCRYMPKPKNRIPLGNHASCGPALDRARSIHANADGCAVCCPRCHRG